MQNISFVLDVPNVYPNGPCVHTKAHMKLMHESQFREISKRFYMHDNCYLHAFLIMKSCVLAACRQNCCHFVAKALNSLPVAQYLLYHWAIYNRRYAVIKGSEDWAVKSGSPLFPQIWNKSSILGFLCLLHPLYLSSLPLHQRRMFLPFRHAISEHAA